MVTKSAKSTNISRFRSNNLGFFFILAGGAAFAATVFDFSFENWWALFIFIPALFLFTMAGLISERSNGRNQTIVRLFRGFGLIIFVDALMFLFNVNWGNWWPLSLITAGFTLFYIGYQTIECQENPSQFSLAAISRWLGGTMILLGITFLFNQVWGVSLNGRFATLQWWGFFLLIPAAGLFANAIKAFIAEGQQIGSAAYTLGFLALLLAASGISELLHLHWSSFNTVVGLALIIGGGLLLGTNRQQNKALPKE